MSVTSEFLRVLGDVIDFLENVSGEGPRTLAKQLVEARAIGEVDVTRGADLVLSFEGSSTSASVVGLSADSDRRRYEDLRDHLLSLCRVVVGRAA